MKFLILNCLFVFLWSTAVQSQNEKIILDFVSLCKDKNVKFDFIKEKYLCTIKADFKKLDEINKFLDENLNHLREELKSKDIQKLTIISAEKDKAVQKEFFETDFSKIFVLKDDSKIIQYFLMDKNEIKSFLVLDKSGIKFFVGLCD